MLLSPTHVIKNKRNIATCMRLNDYTLYEIHTENKKSLYVKSTICGIDYYFYVYCFFIVR